MWMDDFGLNLKVNNNPLGFEYGENCFGPEPELRKLDAIRPSLRDPNSEGPEIVYAIAMDVSREEHREPLRQQMLLFGVVTYAAGRLGDEPIRSQGHVHKRSKPDNESTPEIYEIWQGRAIVYMQESADDDSGRCFAVEAGAGEVVVVPPAWAHATISADPSTPLTFGAWCTRDYGFVYEGVREHGGLAWFPLLDDMGQIQWEANPNYHKRELTQKNPNDYLGLGLEKGKPIYKQYAEDPKRFLFVARPSLKSEIWRDFLP